MSEVPGDDKRVEVTAMALTKLIKDSAHPVLPRIPRVPTTVLPTQIKGPSIPTETSNT